jgi:hypothetical protein
MTGAWNAARRALLPAALLLVAAGKVPELPELNAAIVRFCEEHAGEKVGDGSCGMLAVEALRTAGAKTSRDYGADERRGPVWGSPVETVGAVLPGDVVQFQNVTLVFRAGSGVKYVRTYPEHTAIVARNRGDGRFDVFEQNVTGPGVSDKRRERLRRREVDFRHMVQGTVTFYRAEPRQPVERQ